MKPYPPRDLSLLNTLGVPARAAHFARVSSVPTVQDACAWAQRQGVRVRVLGGGSNVLVAPEVQALVLQPAIRGIEAASIHGDRQFVDVGAGEDWHQLVRYSLAQGWYGLENLSLIPGTVGAAPVQNIGAYGVELSDLFESLHAVEVATGREVKFDLAQCAFGYRDSLFKGAARDAWVITRLRLRLFRRPRPVLSYPALAQALDSVPRAKLTPLQISDAVCDLRRSKLPDPAQLPNCGSFFKNPLVGEGRYRALRSRYPDLVSFPQPDGSYKLAAGWLIERAGWKGRSHKGVVAHQQQALVLTNPQRLPLDVVLETASLIQEDVHRFFGIHLEREPQMFG